MRKSLRSTIATTSIFAMAAILALVMATPGAEAKPRPTVDNNVDACVSDPDTDKGGGGLIRYCCYDDGCWICAAYYIDCVWDPAYGAGKRPKFIPKGNLPELQPVEPKMQPKVQPKVQPEGGIQQQ